MLFLSMGFSLQNTSSAPSKPSVLRTHLTVMKTFDTQQHMLKFLDDFTLLTCRTVCREWYPQVLKELKQRDAFLCPPKLCKHEKEQVYLVDIDFSSLSRTLKSIEEVAPNHGSWSLVIRYKDGYDMRAHLQYAKSHVQILKAKLQSLPEPPNRIFVTAALHRYKQGVIHMCIAHYRYLQRDHRLHVI